MTRPRLAVVLIARDQAWNVDRLIRSVLGETAAVSGTEVVLVDSASRDRTTELAARHPIQVVRLCDDQRLTAAAGRYVGLRRTSSELVLFLDGDMELVAGWLPRALRLLEERPEVAAVSGAVCDRPPQAAGLPLPAAREEGATEVPSLGGAALYRRRVLDEVGPFNPYLFSDEEPELALRIRRAGHRLVQLAAPIALHYSTPPTALVTLRERWRRKLFLGQGQVARIHLGSDLLWPYLAGRVYGLAPGAGLVAGALALVAALRGGPSAPLRAWLALVGSVVAGDAVRRRSLRRTAYGVGFRLLCAAGLVRGFLDPPRDPASYPARVEEVAP